VEVLWKLFRRFGPKSVRQQTTSNAENPTLPAVLGGAPSGFRTPDPLIKNWWVLSFPVGSDSCPVHVASQGFWLCTVAAGRFRSIACHLRCISVTWPYLRWRISWVPRLLRKRADRRAQEHQGTTCPAGTPSVRQIPAKFTGPLPLTNELERLVTRTSPITMADVVLRVTIRVLSSCRWRCREARLLPIGCVKSGETIT
jgi:hypothetical protein